MNTDLLLELGRVVYINYGPYAGKIAVVVDIVNGNRCIVNGPNLCVPRHQISNTRLSVTKYKLSDITTETTDGQLSDKIKSTSLLKKWQSSGLGKRIFKQNRRRELSDFDRFKVMLLKRNLSRAIRKHVNKNRKKLVSSN